MKGNTMYRILLADDEGIMLESLKNIIEKNFGASCEIACAKTGRAVVEQAESFRPDIAFMDIQMPRMNGYDAARAIRAMDRNYCRQIPIIAMTANAFAEDIHAAKTVGMNEHIAKPLDLNTLAKLLKRWIQNKDTLSVG